MRCLQCGEDYDSYYDDDFIDGICLPCQCGNDVEELEKVWDEELTIFEQRTGLKFDYCEFYFYCERNARVLLSNRANIRGLPELNECLDSAIWNLKEAGYLADIGIQLELF